MSSSARRALNLVVRSGDYLNGGRGCSSGDEVARAQEDTSTHSLCAGDFSVTSGVSLYNYQAVCQPSPVAAVEGSDLASHPEDAFDLKSRRQGSPRQEPQPRQPQPQLHPAQPNTPAVPSRPRSLLSLLLRLPSSSSSTTADRERSPGASPKSAKTSPGPAAGSADGSTHLRRAVASPQAAAVSRVAPPVQDHSPISHLTASLPSEQTQPLSQSLYPLLAPQATSNDFLDVSLSAPVSGNAALLGRSLPTASPLAVLLPRDSGVSPIPPAFASPQQTKAQLAAGSYQPPRTLASFCADPHQYPVLTMTIALQPSMQHRACAGAALHAAAAATGAGAALHAAAAATGAGAGAGAVANTAANSPVSVGVSATSLLSSSACCKADGLALVAQTQFQHRPTPSGQPTPTPTSTSTSAVEVETEAAVATQQGPTRSMLLAVSDSTPAAMMRGTWALEDYVLQRRLYKGKMSSVYKGRCLRSGLPVALKVYFKARVPHNVIHMVMREISIHLQATEHKNVLKLYGVFQTDDLMVLVLELAARSLSDLCRDACGGRLNETETRQVVLEPLLESMAYLHSRGICHRDIKPENMLFTADWGFRLADFGVSINLAEERAVTRAGTADYMAPEVERCPLKENPSDNKNNQSLAYTTSADVWSVGVLAYELLVGFPPVVSNKQGGASKPGAAYFSSLSFPSSVSQGARDFISAALAPQPEDRPTIRQLRCHPWMLGQV